MDKSEIQNQLLSRVNDIDSSLKINELEELLQLENLNTSIKPFTVKIEPSKSVEEPISLNTRLVNLSKIQNVTLLACKVIYNAYRENDLVALLRVGILPNYENLLEPTITMLEVFRIFIAKLRNEVDIKYINTPGMTMKEYKKLSQVSTDKNEKCETLLKTLKLSENYALYVLHYNLLSGSTIITDVNRYLESANEAIKILTNYCNTFSKNVDSKVILTRYATLKDAYSEVIKLHKTQAMEKINNSFNKSSKLLMLLEKMEEDYSSKLEELNKIDSIISKMDEVQQQQLLHTLHTLYEKHLILSSSNKNELESDILNKSLKTLLLMEKNYKIQCENLEKLKTNLDKIVVSSDIVSSTKNLEEIILKIKSLLTTQKHHQSTIKHLQHIANELVNVKIEEDDDIE